MGKKDPDPDPATSREMDSATAAKFKASRSALEVVDGFVVVVNGIAEAYCASLSLFQRERSSKTIACAKVEKFGGVSYPPEVTNFTPSLPLDRRGQGY
jgi:hypothetical protein